MTSATVFHNPYVLAFVGGFASGVLAAAKTDYDAFKTWKSLADVKTYSWSIAFFRWGQGGIVGAISSLSGMAMFQVVK